MALPVCSMSRGGCPAELSFPVCTSYTPKMKSDTPQQKLRKPSHKPKHADTDESRRFIETAREVGADESPEAFDRAFKRVVGSKPGKLAPARSRK